MTEGTINPWIELEQIAERGDADGLQQYLETLSGGEAARALARLPEEQRSRVLTVLAPGQAADLLEDIPETQAAELIEQLPIEPAAAIVAELESDEQADLLTQIDDDRAEAILAEMDPAEAMHVRRLAAYPPDVAGGLMITEYLEYQESSTASGVVDDLRRQAEAYSDYDVQYVYVADADGRLAGVLRLRDLLLTPASRAVGSIMIRDPLTVPVDAPLDELAEFFDRHEFIGVPAIDEGGRLVGVVRRRDVREALGDRAESDHLKSRGIVGGEELRSMPVLVRSGRRLSWLTINVVLNIIAASVIAMYQETLAAVIALAVFLPIISDMSGCSGNQAVAVSMRELAIGVASPRDALYIWSREISVGLINGLVLGALLAGAAWLWQGNAWLGLVVGVALAANTIIAVSLGGTVPLILRRMGMDPALASGPILTTVTDMCGFFLVLSLAAAMLSRLV
ncbi:MAG: magnesium transporter [Planctomycetota bacterium]|jgi:magnesium transporter